jgi:hypothetical protein
MASLQFDGKQFKCVSLGGLEADAWGYMWDGDEHYATSWANANAACKARGGRLPTVTELFRVSAAGTGEIGTPYDANYLWSNNQWHPASYTIVRLTDGGVTGELATNGRPYRCVFPNNPSAYFAGNHCYGPPGAECYTSTDPNHRYNIDKYDRPLLTYMGAVDECNFYHATLAATWEYAELAPHAPGLPNGSNNWLWTSDSTRYDAVDLVRWSGTDLAYAANGANVSYAQRTPGSYRFRCLGVNFAAGTHPNTVAGEVVAEETYLKSESADRPKSQMSDAITTCFNAGGHLPLEREWMTLVRAGLPAGSNTWLWSADASRAEYTQVVLWKDIDLSFTGYYSANSTWADRAPTNQYPYRCAYYPFDAAFSGPEDGKCVVGAPCYVTEKGGDEKALMWADPTDRAPLSYMAAVQTCYGLGGHLSSFRDLFELIRDGLPQGSGTWVWTTDGAGDNGLYVMVVKWVGVDKAYIGTNPTYASYSDKNASTSRPYRCVWTNELR